MSTSVTKKDSINQDNQNLKKYPIFLSSLCNELMTLRENIFCSAGKETHVYVDEMIKKNRDIKHQDDLLVADELIKRIRDSNTFICVLGSAGHGTSIKIEKKETRVSFFEVELMQAALLQKKVYLFIRDDFNPDPQLEKLLDILDFYLPEWICQKRLNDKEILDQVIRIVQKDRLTSPFRTIQYMHQPIRRLKQGLCALRNQDVYFLNKKFEERKILPDRDILKKTINLLQEQPHEEKKLSRLWIGLRELMSVPYTTSTDQEILQFWNSLFGEWAKAGAWYGLHGDTPLGCLAALNSMVDVRKSLNDQFDAIDAVQKNTTYPGGPLASAKYSIAKHLYVKKDREERFNEALEDINKAMIVPGVDKSNLRAIRGSIYLKLGHIADAVLDYEYVLRLRRKADANSTVTGEAMSELGFAYLQQQRFQKGFYYCKKGVDLLRQGTRPGFLIRGLKKLAVAYKCIGKKSEAYETKREAEEVANQKGVFDQL